MDLRGADSRGDAVNRSMGGQRAAMMVATVLGAWYSY